MAEQSLGGQLTAIMFTLEERGPTHFNTLRTLARKEGESRRERQNRLARVLHLLEDRGLLRRQGMWAIATASGYQAVAAWRAKKAAEAAEPVA